MGKVIAVTNQKGGVGKTTTTVNLGACLALAGCKVLVVDFDPQGNASSALGTNPQQIEEHQSIYQALIGEVEFDSVIRQTEIETLYLAPTDRNLAGAEIELVSAFARETKLKFALAKVRDRFDYILIDSPPSLGLLTINALVASDSFLVPLQCEYFALEGLSQLMHTVSLLKAIHPTLEDEGVVLTMFDGRNKLSNEVEREVRTHFGRKVFSTVVPRNVRLSECSSFGKPIVLYDMESKGSAAYVNLAKELIDRNRAKTESFSAGLSSSLSPGEQSTQAIS